MLEAIFEKIRGKRVEAARSLLTQYFEMVDALATGDEIDIDFLATTLETLGKTEDNLAADVKKTTERSPHQAELARLQRIQATIPKLRLDVSKAEDALNAAFSKLRPVLDAAQSELRDAENEASRIGWLEDRLVETVADPSLIERQRSLSSERREIALALRPLTEDRLTAEQYLRGYSDQLAALERDRRDAGYTDIMEKTAISRKVNQVRLNEQAASKSLRRINSEIGELQSQLSSVDASLESLRLEMILS